MKLRITSFLIALFLVFVTNAQEILSPSQAIELALQNNFGIKIVQNNQKIAENNKSLLNSGFLPTITGNAGGTVDVSDINAQFSNGESAELNGAESSRYNASLNLNYTLFDGLGRYYNYKRLKEEFQLSELQARETIENTIFQLFTVYYNLAQLTENVNTFEESLKISKDRIKRAKFQFNYGQATQLDVLNAQVDINNDSINLINAKQQLINAKRDLNLVLGNAVQGSFEVDTNIDFIISLTRSALFEKLKANNVTLQQVEKNIEINRYLVKSNKSTYLPSIGLTGSYGWNKNNNNPASFLTVSTNTSFTGGINLTWNLFDGGGNINRVRNAQIALENQQIEKKSLTQSVERDFYNAWDEYQNRLAIYNVQQSNIITAKNNFDRTEEKFKLGQVTSIEFRQAQLNLLNAELSKNQAKYQAKLAEISVLQLSGELLNIQF